VRERVYIRPIPRGWQWAVQIWAAPHGRDAGWWTVRATDGEVAYTQGEIVTLGVFGTKRSFRAAQRAGRRALKRVRKARDHLGEPAFEEQGDIKDDEPTPEEGFPVSRELRGP
jgi:hypothetical protein